MDMNMEMDLDTVMDLDTDVDLEMDANTDNMEMDTYTCMYKKNKYWQKCYIHWSDTFESKTVKNIEV
jgi:hypothetical protein